VLLLVFITFKYNHGVRNPKAGLHFMRTSNTVVMRTSNTVAFSGKRSDGFTLIELIVVIVILGILAVSAAPKFIDLQKDARVATLRGMMGAVKSANNMVYAKAMFNGANTAYSEHEAGGDWVEDCSNNNCVQIGNIWVYFKYAYVDRNSVAFIIDADISGQSTTTVTNSKTKKKITIPERGRSLGMLNYSCVNAHDAVCSDHDFCQCRYGDDTTSGNKRDSQIIVPKGFPYDIRKHTNGGCYFKYTSAEYVNSVRMPPIYTLQTGGC